MNIDWQVAAQKKVGPALGRRSVGLRRYLLTWTMIASVWVSVVRGDERLFTYSYEADVLPKKAAEFEQWVTLKAGKEDGVYSRWDLREELEYGLTDRLTTALYLNFRSTHSDGVPGLPDQDEFEFKGISSEWKYQILNPFLKPVGLLAYGEVTYAGDEVELEEKLIVQRNFGEHWVGVFNVVLEQEWEFEAGSTESELTLELTAGVAYRLTPRWAIALEAMHARSYPDFGESDGRGWFVGPAVHYGTGRWWVTLTLLPQVSGWPETSGGLNLDAYERVQTRLILGINF